ncbi:hypothetical protein ACRRTK_009561 [Alexandromys fortis]
MQLIVSNASTISESHDRVSYLEKKWQQLSKRPLTVLCFRAAGLDAVELRELSPWAALAPGPRCRAGPRRRRAQSGARPCGLRELEVRVSELGLGYTSDETVLFRYCAGACEAALRIYDLGLRQRRHVRKEQVRAHSCCRPTAYEDEVSFLDVQSCYHTLQELSARECACV